MVIQYPHTITVSTVGGATRDANGDYVTPVNNADVVLKGRAESNSSDGYITGTDGSRIDFSWVIYLPLMDMQIAIGSKVLVNDSDNRIVLSDTVKRFSKGQLNARIWL